MNIQHYVSKGRRTVIVSALLGLGTIFSSTSYAADKLVLQTTWYAQAEQGGYYQALAQGIYKNTDSMSILKLVGHRSII